MLIAHHLVATNHGNERQGVNADRLWLKGHVARLAALVAQHHKGVDVGVEILDTGLVARDGVLEGSLVLSILGAVTAAVASAKSTVAVDIHVYQVAVGALEVHDAIVVQVVTTVAEVCSPSQ